MKGFGKKLPCPDTDIRLLHPWILVLNSSSTSPVASFIVKTTLYSTRFFRFWRGQVELVLLILST